MSTADNKRNRVKHHQPNMCKHYGPGQSKLAGPPEKSQRHVAINKLSLTNWVGNARAKVAPLIIARSATVIPIIAIITLGRASEVNAGVAKTVVP